MQGTDDSDIPSDLPLSFPTIKVNHSIASLASDSSSTLSTMRPTPPSRSHSELGSSLSDSTYDLITNNDLLSESGLLSDDDARTESLASFDGNTPDDGSLINSADDSEEEDALNTPLDSLVMPGLQMQHMDMAENEPNVNVIPTIGDSGYTTQTVQPATSSMAYIPFIEHESLPNFPAEARLVHTIQSANEINCNTELGVYHAPYVGLEIRMAVSKSMSKPLRAYRVAVFSYHPYSVGEVAAHIKTALDANLYDNDIDEDVHLDVYYCIEANSGRRGRREVDLHFDQHPMVTVRGGSGYVGDTQYPLWDLAIFLHTSLAEIPAYEIERHEVTFSAARLAMASCRVPTMDLSTRHPLYTAVPPAFTCGRKTLHLHVTTKQSKDDIEVTRELLPLDLDQFSAIDPRTLGRHLSCLSHPKPESKPNMKRDVVSGVVQKTWVAARKTAKFHVTRVQNSLGLAHLEWIDVCLSVIAALSAIALAYQMQSYLYGATTPAISPPPVTTPSCASNWAELFSKKTIPTVSQKSVPTVFDEITKLKEVNFAEVKLKEKKVPITREEPSEYTPPKSLGQPSGDETAQNYKKYTLDLVGAHTLVLTPAPDLQPTKVSIAVYQDGKKLDSLVKPMANGAAWAIGVHKDQAQGRATVVVRGVNQFPRRGKVPFVYEFQVDFGPAKTSLESIKSMVVEEVAVAQKNAKAMSTRMTTGLQKYFDQFEQSTQQFQKEAMKRVDDTRKALIRLSSSGDVEAKASWKKQQMKQLEDAKKALQRETTALARTIQTVALQQYYDAMQVIRNVQTWREQTPWPVRADDWRPQTALKRGMGNAKDLVKLLKGGPRKIEALKKGRTGCKEKKGRKASPPIRAGRWH